MLISTAGKDGCRISRHYHIVRKSGTKVRREEGNALRLAGTLGIPVPEIYDISITPEGICSICMGFVDGVCLEDAWESIDAADKNSIAQQLRAIISTMRAAQPTATPTLIGACDGPARDCRYISDYTGGPFATETAFHAFILNLGKGTPQLIRETLVESLQAHTGHRIVFSHADLSPRNIIVRDGQIQALLDWEFAGWYPEYWEYVKFFDRPTGCKGWYDLAIDIFETRYPSELLTYQAIARWQRP